MDDWNHEVRSVIDRLLLDIPGVTGGKMFGYPGYKVNGKAFLFVGGSGLAVKLPRDRVQALVGSAPQYRAFEVQDGMIWREWLSIDYPEVHDFEADLPLYEESIAFVAGK